MTKETDRFSELAACVEAALASANVLFQRTYGPELHIRSMVHRDRLDAYLLCLHRIGEELKLLQEDPETSKRYWAVVDDGPDSVDYANHLLRASRGRSFAKLLKECIWDVIRDRLPAEKTDDEAAKEAHLVHAIQHAVRLYKVGVTVLADYMTLLKELSEEGGAQPFPRLESLDFGSFEGDMKELQVENGTVTGMFVKDVRERIKSQDIFSTGRTFRPVRDELRPGPLGDIRLLDNFYGYKEEQRFFKDHFQPFVRDERTIPLLLRGMPGVGKTHLTIAHVLSLPDMTLVNADQKYLEESLEELLSLLGRHHYRQFVLFFDDVDPETIDWSTFRNQIDGYSPEVRNVAIVIATNGEFSPQIRSRCRVFEFRPMNPEVCQEFVSDYLEDRRWMSQPYPNLVSTVAADFTAMFRRGILNELTPRSLTRYFEMLEVDKAKIRRLIRESLDEIVRVPSDDAFSESNNQILERMQMDRYNLLAHKGIIDPAQVSAAPSPTGMLPVRGIE